MSFKLSFDQMQAMVPREALDCEDFEEEVGPGRKREKPADSALVQGANNILSKASQFVSKYKNALESRDVVILKGLTKEKAEIVEELSLYSDGIQALQQDDPDFHSSAEKLVPDLDGLKDEISTFEEVEMDEDEMDTDMDELCSALGCAKLSDEKAVAFFSSLLEAGKLDLDFDLGNIIF